MDNDVYRNPKRKQANPQRYVVDSPYPSSSNSHSHLPAEARKRVPGTAKSRGFDSSTMPQTTPTLQQRPISKHPVIHHPKRRRFRPGTRALMEIRKYQKSVEMLSPKSPFFRLVRHVADTMKPPSWKGYRFTKTALDILHAAAEAYLCYLFTDSVVAQVHTKRQTLFISDIQLTRRIRGLDEAVY